MSLDGLTRRRGATAWLGRVCAVLALGCLALALVAVQRGRAVRSSSAAIVADVRAGGDLFEGVDLGSPEEVRAELDALAGLLAELGDSTRADVDLLVQIASQARALAAAGRDDLGVTRALADTATGLGAATAGLRDTALGGEAGATQAAALVQTVVETAKALNAELARLGAKLALLPELGR